MPLHNQAEHLMASISIAPTLQLGTFNIRTAVGAISVPISTGRPVYILGRNGTGKSALVHNFVSQVSQSVYIPGSRPSYFDNESLQLTPASRRQMSLNMVHWDREP